MSLVINLPPEMEEWLRDTARHEGVDPDTLLTRIVERERQVERQLHSTNTLSAEEAVLLLQINLGMPDEVWQRYRNLIQRRRAEELTEAERQELIEISDRIEVANARRIEHLAALARVRGVTLRDLMDQLGIPRGSDA